MLPEGYALHRVIYGHRPPIVGECGVVFHKIVGLLAMVEQQFHRARNTARLIAQGDVVGDADMKRGGGVYHVVVAEAMHIVEIHGRDGWRGVIFHSH